MKRSLLIVPVLAALVVAHARAQCADWLAGPFERSAPGAVGSIGAATTWDPDGGGPEPASLVVGGSFTEICGIPTDHVAIWDGDHWAPLGDGIAGVVADLIVYNGDLIACGLVPGGVARWHLGGWVPFGIPLGGGGNQHVSAMAVYNGELVVAGEFTSIAGVSASNIARWNGTAWQPLGPGVGGGSFPKVHDLAVYNGVLIAGGKFTSAGVLAVNNIARWNGTGWQSLGTGTSAAAVPGGASSPAVHALVVFGSSLIAGGRFTHAGGIAAERIARWNGTAWSALGAGLAGGSGATAPSVDALGVYTGMLIVGGNFTTAGSAGASCIAGWTGSGWVALGSGVQYSIFPGPSVSMVGVFGTELIVGGNFDSAGGVPALRIARWSPSSWSAFQSPWFVHALAPLGSRMVAGGWLAQATAPGSPGAYHVGAWDGLSLKPLGGGLNDAAHALKSFSQTSAPFGQELVCGGEFTRAGGVAANRVARWVESIVAFPPPEWKPMGAGFNSTVYALERFNGATYAAGAFTASGATPIARIARWDGAAWQPLGSGVNGTIRALRTGATTPNSIELLAGGEFTMAGGASASRIARWVVNPIVFGSGSWSPMGAGFNGPVRAIERHAGSTYAAGDFTASGGTPIHRVARWNGTSWEPVGSGFTVSVHALRSFGARLYAGGAFTTLAGSVANGVARWNGSAWNQVHGGADSSVFALAPFQGELHAGGVFLRVDALSLESPGWARYTTTGDPWIASQPVSQTRSCGEAANFVSQVAQGYSGVEYRWRKNGVPLVNGPTGTGSVVSGAFGSNLSIQALTGSDQGSYDCVVSNACGTATSSAAELTVTDCCYADCNADGALTVADYGCFQSQFASGHLYADCNADGVLTVADFGCFQTRFAAGCP